MNTFRDLSALHSVLRLVCEKVPSDARRAYLAQALEDWGFTKEQAALYASIVLCQNSEGSADWVVTNGNLVNGSWVRGEQQGMAGAWLKSMTETWKFDGDLTYEHKTENYEGYTSLQLSYSRPTAHVESGIWAPPDWIRDQIELFVMSSSGSARTVTFEGGDKVSLGIGYRNCTIDGKKFGRK